MNGTLLYIIAVSLCIGLALGLVCGLTALLLVGCACCAVAGLGVAMYARQPHVLLSAVALAALLVGLVRADSVRRQEALETVGAYIGTLADIEGVVAADPDQRDTSLRLTVRAARINGTPAHGTVLVLAPKESAVVYGDTVFVHGALEAPQSFETDTGHMFDYPGYLRAQGISAQVRHAALEKVAPGSPSLARSLYALKHSFERSLERVVPEPDASLMEGLLLGERHGIPQTLTNAFVTSGLVHIAALSGYNVAIVAEAVFRVLAFLPRTVMYGAGGSVMVLFTIMVGAGATTVRALLMALIALGARYFHRQAIALRMLAVAASTMALWNPESLLHDSSFILSVLATFGLVTLSPWVEGWLSRWHVLRRPRLRGMRSIAASTLAVEIFVLPALMYFSGVVSFVSLPANLLVLPVIPSAMLLGFLAGVVGFVSPALALVPALMGDVLLRWVRAVVATTAAAPLSAAVVAQYSPWLVAVAYVPLCVFAVRCYRATEVSSSTAPRSASL